MGRIRETGHFSVKWKSEEVKSGDDSCFSNTRLMAIFSEVSENEFLRGRHPVKSDILINYCAI